MKHLRAIFALLMIGLLSAAEPERTPPSDREKVEMWELMDEVNAIQRKQQQLQQDMIALGKRWEGKVAELQKAHHAEGCTLDGKMRWDVCKPPGEKK